ncbi:transmembrane protein 222 [Nilaparvata lugens]|uniref:transmembrane protein 222 n=1 Tax=Nilaparvata lugens TaxID=108931 RepID=UPI00193E5645|nr:transmembrane protein 222 [Nilaparvata lugens]
MNYNLEEMGTTEIDVKNIRYPFCVVWTPLPVLSWLFPFIGHMGICTSSGVIRDFAGPYTVTEDNMAFGIPVKYWRLDVTKVNGGAAAWDRAISDAADVYKTRMHNLICDNCHSMVAMALNNMSYNKKTGWNMVNLAVMSLACSRYISFWAWLQTYLPAVLIYSLFVVIFYSGKIFS